MSAPVTQTIPNTRITATTPPFIFQNTAAPFTTCMITIDRTVNGGLNSLTSADTLQISIDYSPDGGATWLPIAGSTLEGGLIVTKGVTLTQDTLAVGIGVVFPIGTGFRVSTVASTPVRIAGTVVYS